MRLRTRKYVLLLVGVLVIGIYSRFTGGWSDLEYYAGAAGLGVLIGAVGLPWLEFAPDGAWRRRPQA